LGDPACLVWEGDCDEEPSPCWDLYKPTSPRQLQVDMQETLVADEGTLVAGADALQDAADASAARAPLEEQPPPSAPL